MPIRYFGCYDKSARCRGLVPRGQDVSEVKVNRTFYSAESHTMKRFRLLRSQVLFQSVMDFNSSMISVNLCSRLA